MELVDSAPDGRWLVYCTADDDRNHDGQIDVKVEADGSLSGDPFAPRLVIAGRDPRPIDDLVTRDASGRFLIVRSADRVLLLDTASDTELDLGTLGADVRADASSLPGHRALAFDAAGKHLAYLRRTERELFVVVRELESGRERELPTGLQEIYRIELAAGDRYAVLSAVADDTNKNSRLDWPYPPAREPRKVCRGPLPRLAARYPTGDRSVKVLLPLAGGSPRLSADLLTPLGSALVLRAPSGELVLEDEGKRTMLASPACAGRVLYADAARKVVLLGCPGKKSPGRADVELVAPGFQKLLKVAVQPTELDAQARTGLRLVPLYPGAETMLVDLETRDVHLLSAGDLVIATVDTKALVRRGGALVLYDAADKSTRDLGVSVARLPEVLVQGPFAFVSPALVDVARGELRGTTPLRPLALSTQGLLLVAEGGAASAERPARGPLRWIAPK